jgi:hypothetical protein
VVWAFTNRSGDEGVLVVVALVDRALSAKIGPSEPFRVPWGSRSCQLAEALGVPGQRVVVARDFFTDDETTLELGDDGTLEIELAPWSCRIWRIAQVTTTLPAFPEPPEPVEPPGALEPESLATSKADPAEQSTPSAEPNAHSSALEPAPAPTITTATRRRPRPKKS